MLNPSVLKYRRRFLFVSFYVFSFQNYDSCYRGGRSNNLHNLCRCFRIVSSCGYNRRVRRPAVAGQKLQRQAAESLQSGFPYGPPSSKVNSYLYFNTAAPASKYFYSD